MREEKKIGRPIAGGSLSVSKSVSLPLGLVERVMERLGKEATLSHLVGRLLVEWLAEDAKQEQVESRRVRNG